MARRGTDQRPLLNAAGLRKLYKDVITCDLVLRKSCNLTLYMRENGLMINLFSSACFTFKREICLFSIKRIQPIIFPSAETWAFSLWV